jgi:hypothetical protein
MMPGYAPSELCIFRKTGPGWEAAPMLKTGFEFLHLVGRNKVGGFGSREYSNNMRWLFAEPKQRAIC